MHCTIAVNPSEELMGQCALGRNCRKQPHFFFHGLENRQTRGHWLGSGNIFVRVKLLWVLIENSMILVFCRKLY